MVQMSFEIVLVYFSFLTLQFTGPLVLQLQRIKDVSKSVASQKDTSQSSGSGRRLLRVYVTDGKSHVSAVEIKKIPELR